MSARPFIIGGSLLAHGALVYTLGEIRVEEARASTSIEVVETPQEKPKPPPVPVDEPPPDKAPPQRSRNTKPAEAPPPDAPQPSSAPLSDLPDFGLDLSGGSGAGGFAVAQGTGPLTARPKAAPVQKTLSQAPAPTPAADTCAEPAAKPKLVSAPQPAYTDAARAAGVEGKVRLQLTVDETGKVVDAKVVAGLGHGLDEAALSAARAIVFEGAVRCGKPSRSTVNFAFRFSAS
ncbi:MAG TPA: energy transducer TonB [Polyangiaceae bacterium]|nr:energy transducer TonB [Polyangiaceae bacterium]